MATTPYPPLTPRQCAVVALVAQGMSNREIADVLFVNEGTVKNHLFDVVVRLKLPRRGSRRVHVARWVWSQEQTLKGESNQ